MRTIYQLYSYQILFSIPIPSQDKGCSLCHWRAPDLLWRAASLGKLACLYNCEKAVEPLWFVLRLTAVIALWWGSPLTLWFIYLQFSFPPSENYSHLLRCDSVHTPVFRKCVTKPWLWCTVGVSLSVWSYNVWMLTWTFMAQAERSFRRSPSFLSNEPHEGKKCRGTAQGHKAHRRDFCDFCCQKHSPSNECWICFFLNVRKVFVWSGGVGGKSMIWRIKDFFFYRSGWLCFVGYLDAFISCMLVAPHTPTFGGKWVRGGIGVSLKGLKRTY